MKGGAWRWATAGPECYRAEKVIGGEHEEKFGQFQKVKRR